MKPLTYLSVCSGIEAATVAWHPLGFKPLAFAEIEKFPSAVLAHHWPDVPNLGDLTKHNDWPASLHPDIIVGGTPCQAFSVAGLRQGLADPRGNLTLVYLALLAQYKPTWCVWENVPGVLSDKTGAFGSLLGGLAQLGYGFAYRILDAQYFGVAQRRRRVFVVGHLGDWRRAAAVLFERESLLGDSPPSRKAGQVVTPTIRAGAANGGPGHGARSGDSKDELIVPVVSASTGDVSHCLNAGGMGRQDYETETLVTHAQGRFACSGNGDFKRSSSSSSLRASGVDLGHGCESLVTHSPRGEGFDASEDGMGRGTPLVAVACDSVNFLPQRVRVHSVDGVSPTLSSEHGRGHGVPTVMIPAPFGVDIQNQASTGDISGTLLGEAMKKGGQSGLGVAVAFAQNTRDEVREMAVVGALAAEPGMKQTSYIRQAMQVRRLTPTECERLQGFPDGHTDIQLKGKPTPDGPRYKALGNSMAVPVMRWIGKRLQYIDSLPDEPT